MKEFSDLQNECLQRIVSHKNVKVIVIIIISV